MRRPQTGGTPSHPEEATESQREYPEHGQLATRLDWLGQHELPHPLGHGGAGAPPPHPVRSEANFGRGKRRRAAHRTKRFVIVGASAGRRSLAPGPFLPQRGPNIVQGGREAPNSRGENAAGRPRGISSASPRGYLHCQAALRGLSSIIHKAGDPPARNDQPRWEQGAQFPKKSNRRRGGSIQRSERLALLEGAPTTRAAPRASLLSPLLSAYCQRNEGEEEDGDGDSEDGGGQEAASGALQGESIARV